MWIGVERPCMFRLESFVGWFCSHVIIFVFPSVHRSSISVGRSSLSQCCVRILFRRLVVLFVVASVSTIASSESSRRTCQDDPTHLKAIGFKGFLGFWFVVAPQGRCRFVWLDGSHVFCCWMTQKRTRKRKRAYFQ